MMLRGDDSELTASLLGACSFVVGVALAPSSARICEPTFRNGDDDDDDDDDDDGDDTNFGGDGSADLENESSGF